MLALLTLMISLEVGNCKVDQALITVLPPNTVHVITVSECGDEQKCWERWIETDGKRIGVARVCAGRDSKFETAPLP